mmetsp:Transcript_11782/g.18080  ORF Transcript_11782/g.18080 Transcript_11782/m.18080 type:complete len:182 (+) Transcript_11782:62-607(+)
MRSLLSIFLLSTILSFLLLLPTTQAQFGIKKGTPISKPGGEAEIDAATGTTTTTTTPQEGFLSEKDAADMSAIIEEASKDVETMAMITKLKEENTAHLNELRQLSPMEVLGGMKEVLDNMKLIEYLFQDKERAVKEMEKEGMIDKAHLKKYRKDPDLLEQDTRRGLYFQFISLAVVGGFIE